MSKIYTKIKGRFYFYLANIFKAGQNMTNFFSLSFPHFLEFVFRLTTWSSNCPKKANLQKCPLVRGKRKCSLNHAFNIYTETFVCFEFCFNYYLPVAEVKKWHPDFEALHSIFISQVLILKTFQKWTTKILASQWMPTLSWNGGTKGWLFVGGTELWGGNMILWL